MLKAAIVGCGKIADSHASQIQRIKGCEIVAVCDKEPLMAQQLSARFPVKKCFADLEQLLCEARPDVVHITTSPESHFKLAKLCLEWGCHVYVEKPFTLFGDEAQQLIILATEKKLKLTAGHDDQFSPVARRMRTLIQGGFLGGEPVHMESYYCYPLGRSAYSVALLGDKKHWVRRLPGKLLQNVISHGIARIAEYLTSESPQVIAYGFTSPLLKSMGENEIIDELRVIISERERTTAYFTFSSQMRPAYHLFRIFGEKNGLVLDQDQETLLRIPGHRFTSYLETIVPSLIFARQHLNNLVTNVKSFLSRDLQMKSGMKFLIESFYRSIVEDGPVPIPHKEILLTARIMEAIFTQLGENNIKSQFQSKITLQGVRSD